MHMILPFTALESQLHVQSKLQQCVNNSLSWLHQNKLMINPSKFSSRLIGTKQKIENLTLNIQIKTALLTMLIISNFWVSLLTPI